MIDRFYPLRDISEAFAYLNEGHATGKVVIALSEEITQKDPSI